MARTAKIRWATPRVKQLAAFRSKQVKEAKPERIARTIKPSEQLSYKKKKVTTYEVRPLKGKQLKIDKPQKTKTEIVHKAESKPKKETRAERRRRQAKDIYVDVSPGRFPSDRVRIIQRLGLQKGEESNIDLIAAWAKNHREESTRWKENYLRAINNMKEIVISTGEVDALEQLEKIEKRILRMSVLDYVLGQLTFGGELDIDYVYSVRGEVESAYTQRLSAIYLRWGDVIA